MNAAAQRATSAGPTLSSRQTLALIVLALAALAGLAGRAQSPAQAALAPSSAKRSADAVRPAATAADPGERKFQANCSRCHSAPEQLNPRIAGTVLMHMRVRASLSAKDAADILRFLAP
jgi:cytochrome c5